MSEPDKTRLRSEKEIFFEALERHTPEARAAFLDGACRTDPVQRARVEALLADHFQADRFMSEPAVEGPEVSPLSLPSFPSGDVPAQVVGRYKLLEKIGEGGFGEVWMAEQREPVKRRVALKIIKLGMDSRQVVARFEAERQALAMMDHENIARIYDADVTETGRPYFVMELVRGVKITDYCDQNQLSTRERLDLFVRVCLAIQHAHQKGIIHRDIKPTNILVTLHDGVPVPKVIDFGIAKATQYQLTDKTLFTQFQQFIGTPAYISPEQAELSGLDVDTRADIYSLGVLLYELLVGQTPLDAKEMMKGGLDALRKIIREREPQRPSTKLHTLAGDLLTTAAKRRQTDAVKLVHQLEGDLDWIVMKCLEKDRRRRYDTASGLVMDIQRHLADEPVTARPPSAAYKLQKAWQRNRTAFTAAAIVAVALLAGTGISMWQAIEATRAKKEESNQRIAADQARLLATEKKKLAEVERTRAEELQKKAETEKQRAEEQLERAEWLVYSGNLTLAQNDFEAGNGGLTQHYLDRCEPKLRGWEHRYLEARARPLLTLIGHPTRYQVNAAAWSPDGRLIVTGDAGGIVIVWNAATGQRLRQFTEPTRQVINSLAFSADSKRVVTGTGRWNRPEPVPGEVKVWNVETGELIRDFNEGPEGHADIVFSVAWSPDGARIATGSEDHTLKIWDAATGLVLHTLTGHPYWVTHVAFSANGQRLASSGPDGTVKTWDPATGQETPFSLKVPGGLRCMTISPDGGRIATAASDLTIRVWDIAKETEPVVIRGMKYMPECVAFSPDGGQIAAGGGDRMVWVYDASSGRERFLLKGHIGVVGCVAFSPDGTRILSGSSDSTAKVWDAERGQEVPTLSRVPGEGHGNSVINASFSADGKCIVTGSLDRTAKTWDAATGKSLRAFPHEAGVGVSVFSPGGERIATAFHEAQKPIAQIWNAGTGELVHTLTGHSGWVRAVAFSPDGRTIATCSDDKTAKIWNAETFQELRTLTGHRGPVAFVTFSPDSSRIATVSFDGTGKIWDAEKGTEVCSLTPAEKDGYCLQTVAFSADGRRLVTDATGYSVTVWDARTGSAQLTLHGHTDVVMSAAFSPDGTRIVSGGRDRTMKIWETKTGHELLSFPEQNEDVLRVMFSPDGQRLLACMGGMQAIVKVYFAPPAPSKDATGEPQK